MSVDVLQLDKMFILPIIVANINIFTPFFEIVYSFSLKNETFI